MVNSIQVELIKLRRKNFLWMMLFSSVIMPLITIFYFRSSIGKIDVLQFFQWSAFSYTPWIILPIVLGVLSTMLIHDEHQNDMFRQLWIIPVNRTFFFLSKFFIVLLYSIVFMVLSFIASVLIGMLLGIPLFQENIVLFLFIKCLEIGVLAPIAMLPILSVAFAQKGYIFPVCATLVYTFLGFVLLLINMYIHPLSSMTAIIIRNISTIVTKEPIHLGKAFFCFFLWATVSAFYVKISLNRKR